MTFAFASTSMQNVKNGFRPILCVCVCVSIDAMLNFDGDVDVNANVKCEHTLNISMFPIKGIFMFSKVCVCPQVGEGAWVAGWGACVACITPPRHAHPTCHACPPPTTHAPWQECPPATQPPPPPPCMPPAMHAPSATHTPAAMHAPSHARPLRYFNRFMWYSPAVAVQIHLDQSLPAL